METPRPSPTIALVTLARSAEVELARLLEPAGLSVRKFAILQRLAQVPGATPADLARTVGVSEADAAPLVRALSTTGFIRRGRDGALAVTDAGAAALRRVEASLTDLDARVFAGRDALAAELLEATSRPRDEPRD